MSETQTMNPEVQTVPEITELSPLGYGNPDAAIRYEQKEPTELSEPLKAATAEIINSGECLVDLTETDDGCIDGRAADIVKYATRDGTVVESDVTPNDTHERAKVAGGGYVTGLTMELAIHPPKETADETLSSVVATFAKKDVFCGAHSGSHEHDGATDCGANDKIELILENGLLFGEEIAGSTRALMGLAGAEYNPGAQLEARNGWANTLELTGFFDGSNGESRLGTILDGIVSAQDITGAERPLAVSKHLAGEHKEKFIVVNYQAGKTFSQAMLRDALQARFPEVAAEHLPQAFVLDVPRVVELAAALTDDEDEQQIALQAGVAFQLATAATLTDGSLRVMAIK